MTCRSSHGRASWVCVAGALIGTALFACASPAPENDRTVISLERPSFVQFRDGNVSMFLERRCATLDCHGQAERPLRIFGYQGLRYPKAEGVTAKSEATTEQEYRANYSAVVALEPELIQRVFDARAEVDCRNAGEAQNPRAGLNGDGCIRRLLLVSKPLGCSLESHGCSDDGLGVEHKGGRVIAQDDNGYACLATWLRGAVDADRCASAAAAFERLSPANQRR